MAARQAIEAAFRAADARLDSLQALMQTYEHDRLLDDGGKWSVRDCLAHVAATARVSTFGQRAFERVIRTTPAPAPTPGGPTIDDRTAQQVAERADKSIAELIAEAKQAHVDALREIAAMPDATLDTTIPPAQPGGPTTTVGGTVLRMLEYHEGGQVDRIENALRARTRWR